MTYNYRAKKTVIAVASELAPGAAANVIGHLALAVGHRLDGADMGQHPLVDGSGVSHAGISRYPVIVVTVRTARLRRLLEDARTSEKLFIADYPEQMLTTGHDDELGAALAQSPEASIRYLGVALHGPVDLLQPLTGKFSLWGNSPPPPT